LPFFKTLRNITNFEWITDCQKSFDELKIHLSSSKILSQPRENENLFLYLEMADSTISYVMARKDEDA
jgi:hypothetical protein